MAGLQPALLVVRFIAPNASIRGELCVRVGFTKVGIEAVRTGSGFAGMA